MLLERTVLERRLAEIVASSMPGRPGGAEEDLPEDESDDEAEEQPS